jgi:hypothetical protein
MIQIRVDESLKEILEKVQKDVKSYGKSIEDHENKVKKIKSDITFTQRGVDLNQAKQT